MGRKWWDQCVAIRKRAAILRLLPGDDLLAFFSSQLRCSVPHTGSGCADGLRCQGSPDLIPSGPAEVIAMVSARKPPITDTANSAFSLAEVIHGLGIIRERYERASTIITSIRAVEGWTPLFNDKMLAGAAMDRLLHHAPSSRSPGLAGQAAQAEVVVVDD